jgi:hypothetical protein
MLRLVQEPLRIGILRGGDPETHAASLASGASALHNLPVECQAHDIYVDADGRWHSKGFIKSPTQIAGQVDVILNALHGLNEPQRHSTRTLRLLGARHTGSNSHHIHHSVLSRILHDLRTTIRLPKSGILNHQAADSASTAYDVCRQFRFPLQLQQGNITINVPEYTEIRSALADLDSGEFILREKPQGTEVVCAVLNHFRNQEAYATLPFVLGADSLHISEQTRRLLEHTAAHLHSSLNLKHYSLVHFMLTPRTIYLLRIDPHPEFHEDAPLTHALHTIGSNSSAFLDHILYLALEKK